MLPEPRPYFADLCDPRRETRNQLHPLRESRMIGCGAVLSGLEAWVGMEEFAEHTAGWFRGFLERPTGSPAPDTRSDVFGRLKPKVLAEALLRWVQVALPSLAGEHGCLEGKPWRGSRGGDRAVHRLSAAAAKARLVLGQHAVADKTHELPALPALWSRLDVRGAVVTIDALGCPKAIAQDWVAAGADAGLAWKDKHPP